jgi:hypothetical protein
VYFVETVRTTRTRPQELDTGMASSDETVLRARALVLHDLEHTGVVDAEAVSLLEEAVSERSWWLSQWEQGHAYIAGLVAQDVQDALLRRKGRWPLCSRCAGSTHSLYIHPEIGGPDPVWVCEETGEVVAALGALGGPPTP